MVSVSRHEKALRELPCSVSRMRPVTLHHCHGGSIKEAGWHVGTGQKQNPFLQIPLHHEYHVGIRGIDSGMGVKTWEAAFGEQLGHLIWVDEQLDYDLFLEARQWERKHRGKSLSADAESTESGRPQ